ncbi:hypothetical protein SRHO_G00314940 [Serrasalmus rhombeus]
MLTNIFRTERAKTFIPSLQRKLDLRCPLYSSHQLLEAVAPQAPRESHGSRAAEDSVPAEERQKGSGEEKGSGSRSEDCCQSCPRPHMPCLQDTDARPKDIQAAF